MDQNLIAKFIEALSEFIKGFFSGISTSSSYEYVKNIPKYGDRSDDVLVLQKVLNNRFNYKLKEDGIFLDATAKAVIETKKLYDYFPSSVVTEYYLEKLNIKVIAKEPEQEREDVAPIIEVSKYDGSLKIVELDIKWQSKGRFATSDGKPVGSVLHYTVSGNTASSAKAVANYFANTPKSLGYQLACPIMDKDGVIYIPKGWNILGDRNNHAGSSNWNGYSGLSATHTGLEVCSYGKLDSSSRSKVGAHEIRSSKAVANIKAGDYHAYTQDQEDMIINWYIYHLKNCKNFKIANICGHDECAPSRKSDPGGSLSMTMPELRKMLQGLKY